MTFDEKYSPSFAHSRKIVRASSDLPLAYGFDLGIHLVKMLGFFVEPYGNVLAVSDLGRLPALNDLILFVHMLVEAVLPKFRQPRLVADDLFSGQSVVL